MKTGVSVWWTPTRIKQLKILHANRFCPRAIAKNLGTTAAEVKQIMQVMRLKPHGNADIAAQPSVKCRLQALSSATGHSSRDLVSAGWAAFVPGVYNAD